MALVGKLIAGPESEPRYSRLEVEEERISAVSPLAEPAPPDAPFLCPGFIDTHTHPIETGLQELFVDLGSCQNIKDVLESVSARLKQLGEPEVMLGFDLEPDRLVEKRYPLRQELDSACPGIPTLVYRVDGHSAALNTPGLHLALRGELPSGTELDDAGEPTGVLRGSAYEQASRAFKRRLSNDTMRRALSAAAALAARQGVTTFGALVGSDDLDEPGWRFLLDTLSALPVRAEPFLQTLHPETAANLGVPRVGGCILIDGSFGSHTAALLADYADSGGNGVLYLSDEDLSAFIGEADRLGLQTAVHAIGDRAVDQVIRCHESLPGHSRARHRIEHAELLNPDLVARISSLGLVLGVQPVFEAWWGGPERLYSRRLGDRWQQTNPWRDLLDAGVVLAGGSDAPITPMNPLAGVRAALEHPNPAQRVKPDEALAMFTTGAAFSLNLEDRVGRLEPGYQADIVLLDKDPRKDSGCRVLGSWAAGNLAWSCPEQED